ncbi:MAG: DUF2339 domain-containing protein [Synergistaceae bacterium]|jgi:uncharacterized membrane protein|nr:DUF2339 domain-containing protein [Synergistaceae bacterium]
MELKGSKIRDYAQSGVLWLAVGAVMLVLGMGFLVQYAWSQAGVAQAVGRVGSAVVTATRTTVSATGDAAKASYGAVASSASAFFAVLERFFAVAEVRLTFSAMIALSLLIVGWRLRGKRRTHALILQGTGTGLFCMTIFAASSVSGLLPPLPAFFLTALAMICGGILALKQDSETLAWFATAIGFAAPMLTGAEAASGAVNHAWLFSWYALLDLGIFAAARFRSWRGLNLLGFVATHIVGVAWCVFDYPLGTLFRVEPFIILFFLCYTGIVVRQILRNDFSIDRTADAVLLIGTPVAFCSIQFPLVWHIENFAAVSAFALGALYVGLGSFLHRRRDRLTAEHRRLIDVFLTAGVFFANLAVPLALPPEGIVLVWGTGGVLLTLYGMKIGNAKMRIAGVALQVAGAALSFPFSLPFSFRTTGMLTAFAALFCSLAALYFDRLYFDRENEDQKTLVDAPETRFLFGWGLLWFYGVSAEWIFFSGVFTFPFYALLALFALSGVFFSFFSWLSLRPSAGPETDRRLRAFAQIPAALPSLLALYLFASAIIEGNGPFPLAEFLFFPGEHPLAGMGMLAWPLFFVGQCVTLALLKDRTTKAWEPAISCLHAENFILFAMIVAAELGYLFSRSLPEINLYWIDLIVVLFLVLIVNVVASDRGIMARLSPVRRRDYGVAGCGTLCALLCLWAVSSLLLAGDSSPLIYMPLLNPLTFAEVTIFLTATWWRLRTARFYSEFEAPEFEALITARVAVAVCTVLMMAWSTVETARIFHFYGRIPFALSELWGNLVFQTTITFLWGLWSLGMMRAGSRNPEHRRIWNVGAALLSCNILKLLLADLAGTGSLTRIVSFLGLGVLLIVIGVLTPLPARNEIEA